MGPIDSQPHCGPVVTSAPTPAKITLVSERFIALHMMLVKISPDAPTSEPAMISIVLGRTNPAAAAARPE